MSAEITEEFENVPVEDGIDPEIEIEVIDEREPEDQVEPAPPEAMVDDDAEPTEEELNALSARVKKRIDKVTFQKNEERRAKEEALRIQEEAIRYAKQVQSENERMRDIIGKGEQVLLDEVRSRTKTSVAHAQSVYQSALEDGDVSKIIEAQTALNRAQIEAHQVEIYTPQQPQSHEAQQQFQPQQNVQNQQKPQDVRFEQWKKDNDWFDSDGPKRAYAMAIHEELQKSQNSTGVIVGSEAYYSEIDSRVAAVFPRNPGQSGPVGASEPVAKPAPPVVAPTSRAPSTEGSPRKVQLTETQVKLATRLGISKEVYAKEMLAIERKNS